MPPQFISQIMSSQISSEKKLENFAFKTLQSLEHDE